MDPGVMGAGITIVVVVASLLITLVATVLPFAIWYYIRKSMGGGVVVQQFVPQVQAMQYPPQQAYVPPQAPQAHLHGGIKQIKKAVCRNCGASKVQEPKTAFIYCDYCGALVDWDFRIAITTAGSAKPGPEYQRLEAQVAPILANALARGDHQTYRNTLTQLIGEHMRSCPASYSPRIGDPAYRAAMLEFQVCSILATDFDPQVRALKTQFEQSQRMLRPYPRSGLPAGIEQQSFRFMYAAFLAHHDRFMQVAAPCIARHPDKATFELIDAIQKSIFAQTYLRNLEKPEQDWLLAELGLQGEYIPFQPQPTTDRHCCGCGAAIPVVAGARCVVCEYCGHTNDVQRPEMQCISCSAPVSIPVGATRFPCPHCRADLRVD